jgi:hypothetical protein
MIADDTQPGMLVFLDCGCGGIVGIGPPDGLVLVVVQQPCRRHRKGGDEQARYLERWESVSPFSPMSRFRE